PLVQRTIPDVLQREPLDRTTDVAARITILEPPYEQRVNGGAGHDAELAAQRDGTREQPAGHANAHAALNDHRQRKCQSRQFRIPVSVAGRRTTSRLPAASRVSRAMVPRGMSSIVSSVS